ncbi:hypothetical protein KI387_003029, partial [Taxus chinensis]
MRGAPLLCPYHINITHHRLSSGESVPVSLHLQHIQQTTFIFQSPNLIAQSLIGQSTFSRRRSYPVDADHISHRRFYPVDADFPAD